MSISKAITLDEATIADLLNELRARGGIVGVVAEAQLLAFRKSLDYNGDTLERAATSNLRDVYFPFGALSYIHMIHTKSQRLVQLARNDLEGKNSNFESAKDSALDLINYASFFVERLNREEAT